MYEISSIHSLIHSFNQLTLLWGLPEGASRFKTGLRIHPHHLLLTISTGHLAANSALACGWLMGISGSTSPIQNPWYLSLSQTLSSSRLSHLKKWSLHKPTGSSQKCQELAFLTFPLTSYLNPTQYPVPSRFWINIDLMAGGWVRGEWMNNALICLHMPLQPVPFHPP